MPLPTHQHYTSLPYKNLAILMLICKSSKHNLYITQMRIMHLHILLKEINLKFEFLASVPLSLPLSILLFLFSLPSFVFIFPPPGCCVSIRTTGAIGWRGHFLLQPGPKERYPPVHTILIGLNFVNIYR